MRTFLRRHKHLYAIIAPSLVCLTVIAFAMPTLTGPIKFFEADYILALTGGQAIFGLRIIPVLIIYLLTLFAFFFGRRWGLKRATIAMLAVAATLSITYKIVFLPMNQEISLNDIVAVTKQLSEEDLPITVAEDLPKAVHFYVEPLDLDELTDKQPNTGSFWYITKVEDDGIVWENYRIVNEASNKCYRAMKLESADD